MSIFTKLFEKTGRTITIEKEKPKQLFDTTESVLAPSVPAKFSNLLFTQAKRYNYDPTRVIAAVSTSAKKHGVTTDLLYEFLNRESTFNPGAKSNVGAIGIAQFMPTTTGEVRKNYNPKFDPNNIESAIDGMAWYSKWLSTQIKSDNPDDIYKAYVFGPTGFKKRFKVTETAQAKTNETTGLPIQYEASDITPSIWDVAKEAPMATVNTAKDIIQGIARSGGSVGLTLMKPVLKALGVEPPDELKIEDTDPKWQQTIQNAIFGPEPIKTMEDRMADWELKIKPVLEKIGLEKTALPVSFIGVFALTALDFYGGGGKKAVIQTISKLDDEFKILRVLKEIGVADDIAEGAAKKFVSMTDKKEIGLALEKIEKLQSTTKKVVTELTEQVAKSTAKESEKVIPKLAKELTPIKLVEELKENLSNTVGKSVVSLLESGKIPRPRVIAQIKTVLDDMLKTADEATTTRIQTTIKQLAQVEKIEKTSALTTATSKFLPPELRQTKNIVSGVESTLLKSRVRAEAATAKAAIRGYNEKKKFIENLEIAVTRELNRPKGEQRSAISFIKHLGEFKQTVINDVKAEAGITKPLRDLNYEELQTVLSGIKKRYTFKLERGFRPTVVAKTDQIKQIDEAVYTANREVKEIKITRMQRVKDTAKETGKGIDQLFAPISTRLKNIDISLKQRIRRFEWDLRQSGQKDLKDVDSFLKKVVPKKAFLRKKTGMSFDDYTDFDLAAKNGDILKIRSLAKKYNFEQEYNTIRKTLDDVYTRARAVGYDIGYQKGYFPRVVKDTEGFLAHFMKRDDWSRFSEAIQQKEMNLGRYLTTDEKSYLINNLIRGYGGGKITLSGVGAMKHRVIDFIDPELNRFYADSGEALVKYVHQINEAIEARKFFGKFVKSDAEGILNLQDSIGAYVTDLLTSGKITVVQEKELTNILRARFAPKGTSGIIGLYKNLSYLDVMGSPINALTQIGDLGFSFYKGGIWRTIKEIPRSIFKTSILKKEDLGIQSIAEEFVNPQKSAKAVDTVFKMIGLDKLDRIGKETLVNSVIARLRSQAKNPNAKFMKEIGDVFGKDSAQIITDLKTGAMTENIKYLGFNKLLDFQPVALSEVPEQYLKGGNGRIFYMLKTWTLKAIDVYRNEAFQLMKSRKTLGRGIENLIKLSFAMAASNIAADELKDLILGRKTNFKDRVIDSVLKLVTFNRYKLRKAQEEGIGRAVLEGILPPTAFIDNIWTDVNKVVTNTDESFKITDLKTFQSIPLVGKLYYWWFGKGSKSKTKETKVGPTGLPSKSSSTKTKRINQTTGLPL